MLGFGSLEETTEKEGAQMKRSFQRLYVVGFLAILILSGVVTADPMEPTPLVSPTMRPLRPDYISNWYIYNDANTDGILNPGDQQINIMDNWWTTVSSGTNHTSMKNDAAGRVNTSPMNHASDLTGDPTDSYWLPRQNRELHFYMSYSQMDNNSASNYQQYLDVPGFEGYGDFMAESHKYTNGWNMGWVINDYNNALPKGTVAQDFDMDIYVHDGQQLTGEWLSNPQVTGSNHMSDLSMDSAGNRVPPKWNDVTKTYDAAANQEYIDFYQNSVNPGFSAADILAIGQSMEVHEENPYGSYVDNSSIWDNGTGRTPNEIKANLTDDEGNPYTYDDAFFNRINVYENESVGGVIAGLSGYDNYDPEINNWGDQQVIRIDLAQNALSQLDEIVMYDFGYAPGSGQLTPIEIIFGVVFYNGEYRIWYDFENDGFEVTDLMPENRIYIARVDITPEPLSMAILSLGGLGLMKIRSRRNRV